MDERRAGGVEGRRSAARWCLAGLIVALAVGSIAYRLLVFGKLQQHVGVRFVSTRSAEPPPAPAPSRGESLERDLAARLKAAAAIGDVTAIDEIARELAVIDATFSLAARIGKLANAFDFDALQALAETLDEQEVGHAAP